MTENRCNTVLVAFCAVPKIMQEYDAAFKSRLQSSFMSAHLRRGVPTQKLMEEMLEINRKKALLLILQDTVRAALSSLPSALSDILLLRFSKGKTFQEIALIQDITIRTAFRRFDKARDDFAAELDRRGLDEKTFAETYLSDPAVSAVCARLSDGEYFTAKSVGE